MRTTEVSSMHLSRRAVLGATAVGVAATTIGTAPAQAGLPLAVRDLEDKIRAGMRRYRIPGVSYGLLYRGRQYVGGLGVTDVGNPAPVTGDTVFRVASTTKTFTGTAVMRLVERARLDLDRTVRSYLPDFGKQATVRQVLNHSAGWLGDFFLDTGTGDDALAAYVEAMSGLPQLTPPGRVFAYNNAALSLAGRLVEVATGRTYEESIRTLITAPLGLRHSAFSLDDLPGATLATPHFPDATGAPVPVPQAMAIPRTINPAGGLISSARDQLAWAVFHLGNGSPLLSRRSLHAMQSHPGPGGTLLVELDGAGVTWMLRPTAEGPKVVQHGGDWNGHHSGFLMVPERDFALTVLTNSYTGPHLTAELFADDWALARFAGLHNLPARPRSLPASELAEFEDTYSASQIDVDGTVYTTVIELVADQGHLLARAGGQDGLRLDFYRKDYVLLLAPDGTDTHFRANFVRGADGSVEFFRYGGRLYRRGDAPALRSANQQHKPLFPPRI